MTRIMTATAMSLILALVPAIVSAEPASPPVPGVTLPNSPLSPDIEQNLKVITPAAGALGILLIAGGGGTNSTTSTNSTTN